MCRYASEYCRYQRTASRIKSPGCWRPFNAFVGVIGIESYANRAARELRNGAVKTRNAAQTASAGRLPPR
jgi:hypothetical protein